MADVFYLPIESRVVDICAVGKVDDFESLDEYATHAINSHDELVNQCNELLKALEATKTVPDGWQLVPLEPTIEMVQAITHNPVPLGTKGTYRAMLAAAPKCEGGAA